MIYVCVVNDKGWIKSIYKFNNMREVMCYLCYGLLLFDGCYGKKDYYFEIRED